MNRGNGRCQGRGGGETGETLSKGMNWQLEGK